MKRIADPDIFRKNVKDRLFKILKNRKYSDNLERGIYNSILEISKEKNIVKKWEKFLSGVGFGFGMGLSLKLLSNDKKI